MAKQIDGTNGNGKTKAKVKRVHIQDHRCVHCGRLLFRGYVLPGSLVEIRCPRCSFMHVYPAIPAVVKEVLTIAEVSLQD